MKDGAPVVPRARPESYYGRPVLKAPVWTWEVPTYFFFGGMAGAAAPLAYGAQLAGNETLARRAGLISLVGLAVSPPLLISDLGRPERFWRMLRVFKPTSPMSVGTWLVTAFGGMSGLGLFVPQARAGAAVLGPLVSTYTAVLIAQTSVPVWHDARRSLPWLFAGSSMASAGGASFALTPRAAAGPARALAVAGAAVELAADVAMSRSLDARVRETYEDGSVRPFHLGARALAVTGAALVARGSRAGGLALCAGSALTRLAVFRAGRVSARAPEQTVGPQRDRLS